MNTANELPDQPFGSTFVELRGAYTIEDKEGKLWLPISEIPDHDRRQRRQIELIRIGDVYYDVQGYSIKRRSYWIRPIVVEGSADFIEGEVERYLAEQ